MLGFKVYYDENDKEFKYEETLSIVGKVTDTVNWFCSWKHTINAVLKLNTRLKQSREELIHKNDFIIIKCKDCDENFIITKSLIDWYSNRKLFIPVRCSECIKQKKK